MGQLTRVTNRFTGGTYKDRLTGHIEGGKGSAAALRALDETVRVVVAKEAVQAMGEPIEQAWKHKLPTGPEPVHMADAVKLRVTKSKSGANGNIQPRKVRGLDADEQPRAYAQKLERGGRHTPARPAARPAFDQNRERALEAGERVLRAGIARVTQ
jgi:hypothetical protein